MLNETKTLLVLDLDRTDDGDATFGLPDDELDWPCVILPRETWVEMGRPGEITVSVQPGDRLNEEEPLLWPDEGTSARWRVSSLLRADVAEDDPHLVAARRECAAAGCSLCREKIVSFSATKTAELGG